jgi:hypothetical protein
MRMDTRLNRRQRRGSPRLKIPPIPVSIVEILIMAPVISLALGVVGLGMSLRSALLKRSVNWFRFVSIS